MTNQKIQNAILSILFVAGDAVEVSTLCGALGVEKNTLLAAADELIGAQAGAGSGLLLKKVGSKLQLGTNPDYIPFIDKALAPIRKTRLSQSLLETLAIIAYRQPVTRIEIEQVRGVHCNYSIAALIELALVRRTGRRKTLGNPMLYGTTDEFLRHFGLSSLKELPKLKELPAVAVSDPLLSVKNAQEET